MNTLWYLKKLSKEILNWKRLILLYLEQRLFFNPNNLTDIFEKYPSTYEKDIEKFLQKAWLKIGNVLKENINKYGSEIKKR